MNFSLSKLLQLLVITLIFPLFFLNGWLLFRLVQYFHPIVTNLIMASLLAFILNYPVSILQKRGVKRALAVGLVFISTLLIIIGLGITLLPIIINQFNEIAKELPQWIDSSEQKLLLLNNWAVNQGFQFDFSHLVTQLTDKLPQDLEFFGDRLFSIILETIDSISEALITVVLTFYLLADGERIWKGLFRKLPWKFATQIQNSIQKNFQNFLIGQVALAFLMGVSLTVLFLILQVKFGLLFGLGIGTLSLIPFGDVVGLALITLIIASHNFWLAIKVLAFAVVIDQLIDQAIAPRLLGSFTGLRPIWVLLSLIVGTYVGGLLGLLIAVPLAGFIKDAFDDWGEVSDYLEKVVEGEELETNIS
ncbi:MAG: AI-2E family transporter [Scytonematopsis contorta HA4267-MV1]|jgi:predicted PurR-regulated permease PerM|nr:AI-2E family transporter [Scytonematopsis contorta HA4267-MV1]